MRSQAEKKIKNIHIIINPAAGKKEPVLSLINDALKDSGIQWEMLITKKAGDGLQFAVAEVIVAPGEADLGLLGLGLW